MLAIITLPSATTIMASSSDWGNVFFSEFLPWGLIAVGIFVSFALITFLMNMFRHGIGGMMHHSTKYEDTSEAQYRKKHHMNIYD